MLKEQGIREYLNKKDIAFNENSSIIGVIFPSKFTYALGPIATALSMQYYAINFSDSGIAIIGLNNVTGKLEDEAFLFVPKEEVTSVKFNKKLMSYELEISTSKGTLAFKVNKTMVGASWHKENLATNLYGLALCGGYANIRQERTNVSPESFRRWCSRCRKSHRFGPLPACPG